MRWMQKTLCTDSEKQYTVRIAVGDGAPDPMQRTCCVVLAADRQEENGQMELLGKYGLVDEIEDGRLVVVLPCKDSAWKTGLGTELSEDEQLLLGITEQADDSWFGGWHVAGDVYFWIGEGTGADLVCFAAAKQPSPRSCAALCAVGGSNPLTTDMKAPIPALLVDMPEETVRRMQNSVRSDHGPVWDCGEQDAGASGQPDHGPVWDCREQDAGASGQPDHGSVWDCGEQDAGIGGQVPLAQVWTSFLSKYRRINLGPEGVSVRRPAGDPEHYTDFRDVLLADGQKHDWLLYRTDDDTERPYALVLVSHGMGDQPACTAEQINFEALAGQEHLIAVYPYATGHVRWNLNRDADLPDDMAYYRALIAYLCGTCPIDKKRIYTAGFSNGAGMAMKFALLHPQLIAAVCAIDSTFPYATTERFRLPERRVYVHEPGPERQPAPLPASDPEAALRDLREALALQRERSVPLRLPVIYFYGSRETEYPIRTGSNQELNYQFWKEFNGIPNKPTDDLLTGEEAVGVPGDVIRQIDLSDDPTGVAMTEHLYFNTEGLDAFHLILTHGKAHDVHPREALLGWAYIRHFCREDKSCCSVSKNKEE